MRVFLFIGRWYRCAFVTRGCQEVSKLDLKTNHNKQYICLTCLESLFWYMYGYWFICFAHVFMWCVDGMCCYVLCVFTDMGIRMCEYFIGMSTKMHYVFWKMRKLILANGIWRKKDCEFVTGLVEDTLDVYKVMR